jgi:hypothetical protein
MTIPRSRPLAGLLTLVAAGALTAALPVASVARTPRTTTCDVAPLVGRVGTATVSSLKVTGARCAAAISVVKAFHTCRLANGPSGRCVRLVLGYACGELRSNSPTQFSATATCSKSRGRKKIVQHYTQPLG